MSDRNNKYELRFSNKSLMVTVASIMISAFVGMLFYTEFITDASIFHQYKILIFTALLLIIPFVCLFVPLKGVASYIIAASCLIATLSCCIYVYRNRNIITLCWVPEDYSIKDENILLKNLRDNIKSNGSIIFIGNGDLKFKESDIKELEFSKRLSKYSLNNDTTLTTETETTSSLDDKSNDEKKQNDSNNKSNGEKNQDDLDDKSNGEKNQDDLDDKSNGEKNQNDSDNKSKNDEKTQDDSDLKAFINLLNKHKNGKEDIKSINNLKSLNIKDIRFSEQSGILKQFIFLFKIEYLPKEINFDPIQRSKFGIVDISKFDKKE